MNLAMMIVAALVALPAGGYLTYQTLAEDAPAESADATSGASIATASAAGSEASAEAGSSDSTPTIREDDRHTGTQTIGLQVGAPYPTCPTSCTVGYGFFGSGGLEFDVPEGATSIEVRASWDALPAQELRVGLYHPDAECGEGCWMGDASAEGSGEVTFTFDDPAASAYRVSAHGAGPAYVVAKQDVNFEVLVRYS